MSRNAWIQQSVESGRRLPSRKAGNHGFHDCTESWAPKTGAIRLIPNALLLALQPTPIDSKPQLPATRPHQQKSESGAGDLNTGRFDPTPQQKA
jgi:hypothetical protein